MLQPVFKNRRHRRDCFRQFVVAMREAGDTDPLLSFRRRFRSGVDRFMQRQSENAKR